MAYVWRKTGEGRWLCIAVGKPRVVVGEVIQAGTRRFRIQLRLRTGATKEPPVVFERLRVAQRILLMKLDAVETRKSKK